MTEPPPRSSTPPANAVGDLLVTEPGALRALAEPPALDLLDDLRREGPRTPEELASRLPTEAGSLDQVEERLQQLEAFGLVERDADGRWAAVGRGFVFEIPDGGEGEEAARRLRNAMLLRYATLPEQWVARDEAGLELDWARVAGLLNARLSVTADELQVIQDGLERVLEPYLRRRDDEVPAGSRQARVLAYFLPEATPSRPRAAGRPAARRPAGSRPARRS